MRSDRRPHIGEYDTKTNAIRGLPQISIAFSIALELGR
jgi:hypothetical protein